MGDSILITGGRVIDPARCVDENTDVFVSGGRIVKSLDNDNCDFIQIIHADGCLVVPGLIDFHTHVFFNGTDNSVPPDVGLLPNGVTTTVDAGTAGTANYELFHKNVIENSLVRIKSFLSVSPTGQTTNSYDENQDPKYYDIKKMKYLFRKYPEELLGLKVRQSKTVVGKLGLNPLRETLSLAESLSCRVAVHTTDSPNTVEELVGMFREGDIFAHVFHGKGKTIIGNDGHVLPEVKAARKKGVIFDAANGKNHFAFRTASAALEDGFIPDIISSDLTWLTMFKQPSFGLPWLMSKYLALGMKLNNVIAACTSIPAAIIGLSNEIGTLKYGSCADVTILKPINYMCDFMDVNGDCCQGSKLLLPQMTIREGRIVFRQLNF